MPDTLAGRGIEGHQAAGEEVVAGPVSPVPVVCLRTDRKVDVTQFLVDGHHRPDVDGSRRPPRLVLPGLDTELPLAGNRVEGPPQFPRSGIEGPDVAGRNLPADGRVADRRADDHDAPGNDWRRGNRVCPAGNVRPEPQGQVDFPLVTEGRVGCSRLRVERDERGVGSPSVEDPRFDPVAPIGDASRQGAEIRRSAGSPELGIVGPDRFPGPRIDRRNLAERSADVEHAIDHQRRRLVAKDPAALKLFVGFPELHVGRLPAPGNLEIVDVAGVDLIEGGVLGVAGVAAVGEPLAVGRAGSTERGLVRLWRRRAGEGCAAGDDNETGKAPGRSSHGSLLYSSVSVSRRPAGSRIARFRRGQAGLPQRQSPAPSSSSSRHRTA